MAGISGLEKPMYIGGRTHPLGKLTKELSQNMLWPTTRPHTCFPILTVGGTPSEECVSHDSFGHVK